MAGMIFLAALALCNLASGSSKLDAIAFQRRDLFPEGIDWDENHGRFLLGSMGRGSIWSLSDTGKLDLFVEDEDFSGKHPVLGVRVDPSRNRVLAVIHNFDDSTPAFDAVASYDLDSSARNFLVRLDSIGAPGSTKKPVANDVTVDREGNLYVTNSAHNFIWKATPDGKNASVFTESTVFTSPPVVTKDEHVRPCGLNGIVYHWDNYLLVGQSNTGMLFKTNLRGDQAHLVKISTPLVGGDGMALRQDGALIVVSSSKAWLLRSSDHWRSASVADELRLNETGFATAVTVRDGLKAYVLHSFLLELKRGSSRSDFLVERVEFPKDAYDDPVWLILVLVVAVVLVFAWRFQMSRFFDDYRRKRQ
ncbi:uncharacterized protein LOC9648257 [Selaginella moellendorffii]|uniref:uncharacterized protein LOC9648257 n=1 Tax=Selaginella moellendorffii TaxID=88036 RepID=UPI000D1C93CC|nr:uncharacterized protein LOC9648257 [Selaginella moellendorffii]|eukprot:XP_024542545.1 uncharacterized protein LOC9648257 [Selaginella moellendorffii]